MNLLSCEKLVVYLHLEEYLRYCVLSCIVAIFFADSTDSKYPWTPSRSPSTMACANKLSGSKVGGSILDPFWSLGLEAFASTTASSFEELSLPGSSEAGFERDFFLLKSFAIEEYNDAKSFVAEDVFGSLFGLHSSKINYGWLLIICW